MHDTAGEGVAGVLQHSFNTCRRCFFVIVGARIFRSAQKSAGAILHPDCQITCLSNPYSQAHVLNTSQNPYLCNSPLVGWLVGCLSVFVCFCLFVCLLACCCSLACLLACLLVCLFVCFFACLFVCCFVFGGLKQLSSVVVVFLAIFCMILFESTNSQLVAFNLGFVAFFLQDGGCK